MIVSHENDFLEHTVRECCHVHSSFCEFIPITKGGDCYEKCHVIF